MKEVVLLGKDDSAYECPFDGTELWVDAKMLPDIEPEGRIFACTGLTQEVLDICKKHKLPLITEDTFPSYKIANKYLIGYFRGELSYMLAYAIYKHYEKIRIYGFDLTTQDERDNDKPRITYWLGIARGLGIQWEICEKSRLYRVIKDNIKDRYANAIAKKNAVTPEDYVAALQEGRDPYCFVSGIDAESVTVINKDQQGRESVIWRAKVS